MYPGTFALEDPSRRAVVMGLSGSVVTYGALNSASVRLARLLRDAGLRTGDHYAVMSENRPEYYELVWAGLRSGLYVTAINSHLTADEAAYIVNDCDAKVLVTSVALSDVARDVAALTPKLTRRLMIGGETPEHEDYERARDGYSDSPLEAECRGTVMLYSSGTTGRPKGVKFPLPPGDASLGEWEIAENSRARYGFREDMVYLNPAPLYHAAPLRVSLAVQSLGGTVVVMEKFDPRLALALIERERVTHSQWVPTMFVRMLKLPESERSGFDLSSHEVAVHAAAPCPVEVKEQMIRWWGPIMEEYYAGTENIGSTGITSAEWLEHRGSVGKPAHGAVIHICDEEGVELDPWETGTVYFEQPSSNFQYHHDDDKTRSVAHPAHPTWRTLGDVGHLDDDGYLYLTDRKAFMIIAGGVNIYPQEIEDVLLSHPGVLDAAVIGVPDDEMGESVLAVVQPLGSEDAEAGIVGSVPYDAASGAALEAELRAWCEVRLAGYKRPRAYEFVERLPRLDNGKLYKRALRDEYWSGHASSIL
jgi:long-chain acyl-CoA synthetase